MSTILGVLETPSDAENRVPTRNPFYKCTGVSGKKMNQLNIIDLKILRISKIFKFSPFFLALGMLAKKKAHILSPGDRGWGRGRRY